MAKIFLFLTCSQGILMAQTHGTHFKDRELLNMLCGTDQHGLLLIDTGLKRKA